ncbi:MAG: serine hydrolase [Bacteroidota bacterium]
MNKVYLPLFFTFLFTTLNAQDKAILHSQKTLDSVGWMIKDGLDLPGLAFGLVLDDKVYYTNAFGMRNIEEQTPLKTSSLFHMASVSKPFVATAVLKLQEDGKIKLEDQLVDHLPYFKMKDQRYKEITIKQLLNHTSGIPDVQDYEWDKAQYDDQAAERYTKSFVNDSLDFKPGAEFSYSNAAYDILADVIAKATGLTFEAYMSKAIFEPLQMANSTFLKAEVPDNLATHPHEWNETLQMKVMEIYPYNRIHAPSSTLHSNVDDMLKWALLNLHHGMNGQTSIYSKQTYQLLTTPTWNFTETRAMCLGWFTTEIDGQIMYYHYGGDEGYRTFFAFFPDQKAAITLMGNSDYLTNGGTVPHLIKKFITNQPSTWKQSIQFKLKDLILTEGIDSCKAFYYQVQKHQEEQYDLGSGNIDQLGYWLLDRAHKEKALEVFLFNIELNPEHAGFHDSVGDAYQAMNQTSKAIEWYEKALKINPEQDFTIEKLKKIKG